MSTPVHAPVPASAIVSAASPAQAPGAGQLLPRHIHDFLAARVLGQGDCLEGVAVAVYKHLRGIKGGRIFIIGSSGTGKTTLMRAVQQFFLSHERFRPFAAQCILNARTLVDENGDVDVLRIFEHLEAEVEKLLGREASAEDVARHMERATVCLDEIDKISGVLAGKPDVVGLSIQQALLTLIEGEEVQVTVREPGGGRSPRAVNTGRMLFIGGGAFEELYGQVYRRVENKEDERRLKEVRTYDSRLGMRTDIMFSLKDYLKMADLYDYGMAPQFLSRFSGITILEDLDRSVLRTILLQAEDSPYRLSRLYFKTMGIELTLTNGAVDEIVDKAYGNTRIGARALREVFHKIATPLEFDPFGSGLLRQEGEGWALRIDQAMARKALFPQEDEEDRPRPGPGEDGFGG